MPVADLIGLQSRIASLRPVKTIGRVSSVDGTLIRVRGLSSAARIGDYARIMRHDGAVLGGEVLRIGPDDISILPDDEIDGVSLYDPVSMVGPLTVSPSDGWVGRVIDPFGKPLDGKPLASGAQVRPLRAAPPDPATRRALGERLSTAMTVFNTLLPIVKGQRVGLFAGSGVGKSSLMAHMAQHMQADVVVLALVGERGRELGHFVREVLGEEGMARSVVIAATSDRSALVRRRCLWTAMCVAEHFRDQGKHVLFLADSITRFAEAHREVAVAAGEVPALRGYPASTAHQIMALCERAGPGTDKMGDITALFSVLVAGSDMEEPVADILRGVLDGHVVLDRQIAERGRYPAIDLLRSVSRSLPQAATPDQNDVIGQARRLLGAYAQSETMVRAGLYRDGSDPVLDQAIRAFDDLDQFLALVEPGTIDDSFNRLRLILRKVAGPAPMQPKREAPRPQQQGGRRPAPARRTA